MNLEKNKPFSPRVAFGSHSDSDHVYNTPRAWFMGKYFNPKTFKWEGEDADYTPLSDDIPWSFVPEKKITIEDVKYILSSYYQGTEYNPYSKSSSSKKGIYRPIGISRTGVMAICQIRNNVPEEIKGIEWICFGSNSFNTIIPLYTNVNKLPDYVSKVTLEVSTNNFYWSSSLIGALADANYGTSIIFIERYQNAVMSRSHQILKEFDKKYIDTKNINVLSEANNQIAKMAKEETSKTLNNVLYDASLHMKNGYSRSDN